MAKGEKSPKPPKPEKPKPITKKDIDAAMAVIADAVAALNAVVGVAWCDVGSGVGCVRAASGVGARLRSCRR